MGENAHVMWFSGCIQPEHNTNGDFRSEKLKDLWRYVETVYAKEEQKPNQPNNFKTIAPNDVSQTIDKINQAIQGKDVDKKVKQKLNYAKRN